MRPRLRLRPVDREVLRLAVPALGALVAEPLFLLSDAAIIGRTGVLPLAGLAAGGAVLATAVGLFVVLAYATTAAVARRLGAGDLRGALAQGVDGAWLGLAAGVVVGVAGWLAAPWLVEVLGTPEPARDGAVAYLRWSLPGLPGMLLVLAATGVLRGLQDTRTPLVVALSAAVANVALDLLLVLGAGLGLAGAGLGTALAQTAAGAALAVVVARGARRHGSPLLPHGAGVRRAAAASAPLLVRTVGLRAALLVTTAVAASQGVAALAGHHVVMQVWTLTALALDAVAIAAQALVGRYLGAGDVAGARAVLGATVRSGAVTGVVLGVAVLAASPWLPAVFTPDAATAAAIGAALVVVAVAQPLAGWVFVLDGVLMGAGDGRYLAVASVVTVVAYLPLALAVQRLAPGGTAGLVALWVAFGVGFVAARAATLALRVRGEGWLVLGATR